MKIGRLARLVQPVVSGPVADKRYNKEKDCLEYLVVFKDKAGEVQHRWFLEAELEELPDDQQPNLEVSQDA